MSALLVVEKLVKRYPLPHVVPWRAASTVEALAGVSLSIQEGRNLGIVGESGSGKSTLARCVMALVNALKTGGSELKDDALRKTINTAITAAETRD